MIAVRLTRNAPLAVALTALIAAPLAACEQHYAQPQQEAPAPPPATTPDLSGAPEGPPPPLPAPASPSSPLPPGEPPPLEAPSAAPTSQAPALVAMEPIPNPPEAEPRRAEPHRRRTAVHVRRHIRATTQGEPAERAHRRASAQAARRSAAPAAVTRQPAPARAPAPRTAVSARHPVAAPAPHHAVSRTTPATPPAGHAAQHHPAHKTAPAAAASRGERLANLQATLAGALEHVAVLTLPPHFEADRPADVTLSVPAGFAETLRDAAAKQGLAEAAASANLTARLAGDGYTVAPDEPQAQPLMAGQPTVFHWTVTAQSGAHGALKAELGAVLLGGGSEQLNLGAVQAAPHAQLFGWRTLGGVILAAVALLAILTGARKRRTETGVVRRPGPTDLSGPKE